jgi:hypothetical protein
MHRARTAFAPFACALAWLVPAPASAAIRVERTVVLQSAPHGGVTPAGSVDAGSAIQELHVRVPRSARVCAWTLTDPATGQLPAPEVFGGQTWQLLFAGMFRKGDWGLTVRVVNPDTRPSRPAVARWRIALRCATTSRQACHLEALTVPRPDDYVSLGFSCRSASSRFRVTLPRGYEVKALLVADNSYLHEAMSCEPAGRTLSCRGRTPAGTTTWLGFFTDKPVASRSRFGVSVPHRAAAAVRARRLELRF